MIKALLILEGGAQVPIQIRQRNVKYLIYALSGAKKGKWRRKLRAIRNEFRLKSAIRKRNREVTRGHRVQHNERTPAPRLAGTALGPQGPKTVARAGEGAEVQKIGGAGQSE